MAGLPVQAVEDPERAARFLGGIPGWREDLDLFSRAVTAGAPANGFRAGLASLRAEEWRALHGALAKGEAP